MKKLAVVTTHPIQYNAPFFRRLTERGRVHPAVFYTWGASVLRDKFDPGFGKIVEWDIPLLDGYEYHFTENISPDPGSHHFRGIRTPDLNREISAWQPDAVLVYGWSFWGHLSCMHYFHGRLPVLFRGDSTLLDDRGGLRSMLRRWFLHLVYRQVDMALFTGKQNYDYFRACGLKNHQLLFAPHAVDNQRFEDTPGRNYAARALQLRTELGFRPHDIVFLFAGKLESKKDPELLMNAFRNASIPEARLLIVGNGMLEARLLQLAEGDARIRVTGFRNQSDMPVLYRTANWFILPSKGPGETWGLAVNEAMASGIPVITSSRCGCTPDLVQEGVNGFTFPAADGAALTRVLEKAVKADADAMGRAAAAFITGWSVDRLCESVEKIPALQ